MGNIKKDNKGCFIKCTYFICVFFIPIENSFFFTFWSHLLQKQPLSNQI